jgi:hypothetical protein
MKDRCSHITPCGGFLEWHPRVMMAGFLSRWFTRDRVDDLVGATSSNVVWSLSNYSPIISFVCSEGSAFRDPAITHAHLRTST